MKKLNKKSNIVINNIKAYACSSPCGCQANPCSGGSTTVQSGAYSSSIVWANIP